MKIFNWLKPKKKIEAPCEARHREAQEAVAEMNRNPSPETMRVARDKLFLDNFGHMYE